MITYLLNRYRWPLIGAALVACLALINWLNTVIVGPWLVALGVVTGVVGVTVVGGVVLFIVDAVTSTRAAHTGPLPRWPEAGRRRAATPAPTLLELTDELGTVAPVRSLQAARKRRAA